MPTLFTRIIAGEIPAAKVYEDALTFAFLDIAPASRGHTLVVCKAEHPDLLAVPPETLAAVHIAAQRVARALTAVLAPDGINIVQNNGAAAGQSVFHYHVHVIPRWQGDGALPLWTPGSAAADDLSALAAGLRATL